MSILGTHHEIEELGGGRFQLTQHMHPICYRGDDGYVRRIGQDWQQGDAVRPHLITAAPFMVSVAPDGLRRIHPTRDPARYFEFGAPYIKPGGQWQKVNLGQANRAGNVINWQTANADVRILFGGHYVKLEIPLKGGWQPPGGQFAFPVGLTGLTRQGGVILADGAPVMSLQAPVVYDAGNPEDVRQIGHDFARVGQQWYAVFTLPSLAGMSAPVIDPTLTLQPNATDGIDTMINETAASQSYNYGVQVTSRCGQTSASTRRRILIKFDISSLPAGATLTAATCSLKCFGESAATDYDIGAHRALTQWYEGVKNGAAPDASQDGSSWDFRNTNGSVAWGAEGGQSGTDYTATATGTVTVTGTGSFFGMSVLTDVDAWYQGTATNYGWFVINVSESTNNSAKEMYMSDDTTAGNRPKLVIDYTTAGNPYYAYAQQ